MRASTLLILLIVAVPALAQVADSAALDGYLRAAGNPESIGLRARGYLYQRFDARDPDGVRLLLRVMASHHASDGWITPRELLLARIYAIEPLITRDPDLDLLLAAAPLKRGRREDDLISIEQAVIRTGLDPLSERYLRAGFTETEYRFLNLLIDHLLVNGFRARSELDDRVDRFVETYPESPLSGIAERRFRYPYREERFGLSFGAGYLLGRYAGTISERFAYLHGPWLNGEVYVDRITILGAIGFGAARVQRAFDVGDDRWERGNAPFVHASLLGGYELRAERFAATPLVGIALQSLRSPGESSFGAELPTTGGRIGLELGGLVSYRIPFDLGTHIDLRARAGWSAATLAEYDDGFGGSIWFVGFGFALVQRPYLSLW